MSELNCIRLAGISLPGTRDDLQFKEELGLRSATQPVWFVPASEPFYRRLERSPKSVRLRFASSPRPGMEDFGMLLLQARDAQLRCLFRASVPHVQEAVRAAIASCTLPLVVAVEGASRWTAYEANLLSEDIETLAEWQSLPSKEDSNDLLEMLALASAKPGSLPSLLKGSQVAAVDVVVVDDKPLVLGRLELALH